MARGFTFAHPQFINNIQIKLEFTCVGLFNFGENKHSELSLQCNKVSYADCGLESNFVLCCLVFVRHQSGHKVISVSDVVALSSGTLRACGTIKQLV